TVLYMFFKKNVIGLYTNFFLFLHMVIVHTWVVIILFISNITWWLLSEPLLEYIDIKICVENIYSFLHSMQQTSHFFKLSCVQPVQFENKTRAHIKLECLVGPLKRVFIETSGTINLMAPPVASSIALDLLSLKELLDLFHLAIIFFGKFCLDQSISTSFYDCLKAQQTNTDITYVLDILVT
ncbi:hypothetical protein ACJX0J_039531, partial [Zea mays]